MTNYNKINKYHTILLFLLSLFCLILSIETQIDNVTIICFFLIASLGVSHGSLDYIKGAKLLKIFQIKNKLSFYLIYVFFFFDNCMLLVRTAIFNFNYIFNCCFLSFWQGRFCVWKN